MRQGKAIQASFELNELKSGAEEVYMPSTKKTKTAAGTTTKKQRKAKAAKKAKAASAPPIDWSNAIAKAAEQKRTQASWPGSGESWKKKVRI